MNWRLHCLLFQRVLHKSYPLFLESVATFSCMGLYMAYNDRLFENKLWPPIKVSQQIIALTHTYKDPPCIKQAHLITLLNIDHSKTCKFFDGACQGPKMICGLVSPYIFIDAFYIRESKYR